MTNRTASPFLTSLAHHAADPFRLLVESVVEYAIFMVDPAGRVASWNPGAERIYGFAAEEIIEAPLSHFYRQEDAAEGHPEESLEVARAFGQCVQDGLRVRKDGSHFWAEVTTSNLKDYLGNDAGFSVVTRDVTERKDGETALRRERDLTRLTLNSLPGVFYMYDEQGRFLRWNKQFEVVTEYSAEEISRLHPLDFFEGDEKTLVKARIENVFRTGWGEVEAHFTSKSGRRRPYYFNGVLAHIDGQPCLLGMGYDLSTYKRAEREWRAADERLRLAARAANVGLWDWDLRTDDVFYSAEWKRQIGYEEHEIGGDFKEWRQRVHPEDIDGAMARMRAAIDNPSLPYHAEFRLRHKDGSYRSILSQGSFLFDESGRPIRMMGSHIDLTEPRRAEKQVQHSQKMEAVGLLAGGVAHDFNNLLTIINGYADLVLESLHPDDPMNTSLAEIKQAGEHAASLTRRLLAFSRQQVLEPRVLDLNTIVTDTEKMLRRLIGEDILLSTNLDPLIGLVKVDPGQIEQVLVNLSINARDAMPTGGRLTIETRAASLDETYCRGIVDLVPGDYVMLAVTDTGAGMDDEVQSRIFEPFFTTKDVGKGTGLGLSTVHGIVKQSRGHVAVYSELGHGTVFKVYLPRVDAAHHSGRRSQDRSLPTGTETILLVEDDNAVRSLARQVLTRCGYEVLEATNGAEGLAMAAGHQGHIALLISDVVMPHLGGRELATQLAGIRPDCRVLFLSGYARDSVNRLGVLQGDHAFLQKPFSPSALAQKVRSVLDDEPEARSGSASA